jgi:outer membrane protein insertion porin family
MTLLAALLLANTWPFGAGEALAKIISVEPHSPEFEENPPYGALIREIYVEGNKYTRESVILGALKSQVGQPYTEENAHLDFFWVFRLGAFTAVSFHTQEVPDGIALIVIVDESTPYVPGMGFSYSSDDDLRIGPAVDSSNLFGTASQAWGYYYFGRMQNAEIGYEEPQLTPRQTSTLRVSARYRHLQRTNELLDFKEKTDEAYLELMRTAWNDLRTGLRFRYIRLQSDRDGVTLDSDRSDEIPALGLFVEVDSRNWIYPTGGWFLDLEAIRYGLFGENGEWWRLDADLRKYTAVSFLGDRHSLAFTTYASLQNGTIGASIPAHQGFFIGGTNSVRGWSSGSRYGKNQWLSTVEYRIRLMEQRAWRFWFIRWSMGFQLGVFGDLGTVWSEPSELQGNVIGGYGIGLRLTGPEKTTARIDLAYGEEGLGFRFYVGGGERAEAQKTRIR